MFLKKALVSICINRNKQVSKEVTEENKKQMKTNVPFPWLTDQLACRPADPTPV